MDGYIDTYDIDLSEDKVYGNETIIDDPGTGISALTDIGTILPAWDTSAIQEATASLAETCHKVSVSIQPAISAAQYMSTISKSIASSMSQISESLKPLASICDEITTTKDLLKDVLVPSVAVAETLSPISEMSMPAVAKNLCSSIEIDPSVTTAYTSALQVQASIVESVKPIAIESVAMEGVTSISKSVQEMFAVNSALTENVSNIASSALTTSQPTLVDFAEPAVMSVESLVAERFVVSLDFSCISAAIAKLFDFKDLIAGMFEHLRETVSGMMEAIHTLWDGAGCSFSGLAHLLFRALYHSWQKRPRLLALPWHNRIKNVAALANIGLSPPQQVREFVVRIRQTYLLKHQRISDDSEDLDNSFSLILAT